MTTTMDTTHIPTLEQMADFVSGAAVLHFVAQDQAEAYEYIAAVLAACGYRKLRKPAKGIVRAYLMAVTGYSRAQLARLIHSQIQYGRIARATRTQPVFAVRYSIEDIIELARIDELHERLSGPATVAICKREHELFGNESCCRLKDISVSHLYNLRRSKCYQRANTTYTKTKPTAVRIGERIKPIPDDRPGFIRVDTVHQGDKDGEKGVYHINLVDEITQWEVVVAVEAISERYVIPALVAAFDQFPFTILNFHADNGSEYINRVVAELLERLRVKFTKSRPRHSGDNGLVETKNGAVIRKALGYLHIPRTPDNVKAINQWYAAWFVPYLNFHRPCAFRLTILDPSTGRQTHRYPKDNYIMPYEKLKSLLHADQYLRSGVDFDKLDLQAYALSDTQWAAATAECKAALWESLQL